jgi:hypothetical protein
VDARVGWKLNERTEHVMAETHEHKVEKHNENGVESVTTEDTSSDVESKSLGLDDLTGTPSDNAADAKDADQTSR